MNAIEIAKMLLARGLNQEAIEAASKIEARSSDFFQACCLISTCHAKIGSYEKAMNHAVIAIDFLDEKNAANETEFANVVSNICVRSLYACNDVGAEALKDLFSLVSPLASRKENIRSLIIRIADHFIALAIGDGNISMAREYIRICLRACPDSAELYTKLLAVSVDEDLFVDMLESQSRKQDFIKHYIEKVHGSAHEPAQNSRLIFLSRYYSHVDWARRSNYRIEKFSDLEFVDVTFSSLAFRNPGPFKVAVSEGHLVHAADVVVLSGSSGLFFSRKNDTFSFRQMGDNPTSPRSPAFSLCSADQFLVDIAAPKKFIEETCFLASYQEIYYHFLLDCGPTLRAYAERYNGSGIPLVFFANDHQKCEELVRYLGISAPILVVPDGVSVGFNELIIPAGRYQIFSESAWFAPSVTLSSSTDGSAEELGGAGTTRFSWRELSLSDQASTVTEVPVSKHVMSKVDIEYIRSNARTKFHQGRTEKIFITRRDTTLRKVDGEDELENALREIGFHIICPSEMLLHDQIKLFSNAAIIIAQHGGALANLVFAPAGAIIIELQFPSLGRFPNAICVLAHLVGLKHRDIVFPGRRIDVGKVLDALSDFQREECNRLS